MKLNGDNLRVLPLLLQKSQTNNDGTNSLKRKPSRGSSPSGKRLGRPCKNYLDGNCTNPSCDSWHPPVCQNYNSQSGCKFGEKCSFLHRGADRQPNKRPKKGGGKGAVALLKNSKQMGCEVHDIEPPKFMSILRTGIKVLGPRALSAVYEKRISF